MTATATGGPSPAPPAPPPTAPAAPPPRRSRWTARLAPYFLVFPAWLWLVIFFVVPTFAMLSVSTMTGDIVDGFTQTFAFSTYSHAWSQFHTQIIRSLIYGLIATAICLVIAYPVAYWIAFRGGRHKST